MAVMSGFEEYFCIVLCNSGRNGRQARRDQRTFRQGEILANSQWHVLGHQRGQWKTPTVTFITIDPGYAPADKPRGNEAKPCGAETGPGWRKGKIGIRVQTPLAYWQGLPIYPRVLYNNHISARQSDWSLSEGWDRFPWQRELRYCNFCLDWQDPESGCSGRELFGKYEWRNRVISCVRSLVERPFAGIMWMLHDGPVLITTPLQAHAKNFFVCFRYNLFNLIIVQNAGR